MCQCCFWRSTFNCICRDKYKTQRICDEAVADSLAALNFISEWFVTSKMIKEIYTALTQMKIYSTLIKILIMLYLSLMEWVFLKMGILKNI